MLDAIAAAQVARQAEIRHANQRRNNARMSVDFLERMERATRDCVMLPNKKQFLLPPRQLYMHDCLGLYSAREVDLRGLIITNEWVVTIVNAITAVQREKKSHGKSAPVTERLICADTSLNDSAFHPIHRLKYLTVVDISRCYALTDESLTLIRRHLNLLQELHINDCRHFTADVLCQVWRDCTRLHTITARACPAITDSFLHYIAVTKRGIGLSSTAKDAMNTLRVLDIQHCKHVTSSGISSIATSSLPRMKITHLNLSDCMEIENMGFFGFETSPALMDLQSLDLSGLRIDETGLSWIAKGCQRLERLHLGRCTMVSDFALSLLSPLISGQLRYLNLKECTSITDQGISNLFLDVKKIKEHCSEEDEEERIHTKLEMLILKNCTRIGDDSLKLIGTYCIRLIKLNLKGLRKISDQGILYIGKGCPQLRSIKLSGRHLTEQTFKVLGKLCCHLQAMDVSDRTDELSRSYIDSLTAPVIGNANPTTERLRKLNFTSTTLCDQGLQLLATRCRQLIWINLSKCKYVTDIGVQAIAFSCHRLQVLLLSNTKQITDRSLMACGVMQLPLHIIDLCGNINITYHGLDVLCSGCPLLREVRLKGCEQLLFTHLQQYNQQLVFTNPIGSGGNAHTNLNSVPSRHASLLHCILRQYECASFLQMKFRQWKIKFHAQRVRARKRYQRRSRAARKIQRCIRSFLSWRRQLHRLKLPQYRHYIALVQAHIRGNQSRFKTKVFRLTRSHAARIIQKAYHPHYTKRMIVRNTNAVIIQRIYRGYCGRCAAKQALLVKKQKSVKKIWKWYRKCIHQRDFLARSRWIVSKVHSIQGQWRVYQRRKHWSLYLGFYRQRATKIQTIWRGFWTRNYVANLRNRMTAATLLIQRIYRGHHARVYVRNYRALATSKVIQIQAQWRRFIVQREYLGYRNAVIKCQRMSRYATTVRFLRNLVSKVVAKHRDHAARMIQRCQRGHMGRRRALLFRKIRNAKYAQKGQNAIHALIRQRMIRNGAVLRIQKWIKRILTRRQMLKMKKWRQFLAANAIQRYFKAWVKRLHFVRKRETQIHGVENIQRVYRGYLGRKAFRMERYHQACAHSARIIQRIYRGFLARRHYKKTHQDMVTAARRLQRAFRGRRIRLLYEIAQASSALKAKEKYDKSILGMIDAKRNPMDELYRRAKLPRERDLLQKLKEKWQSNRIAQERAARKLKRECGQVWQSTDETITNHYQVRRKLYGVTENIYQSRMEYLKRQNQNTALQSELVDLHVRMMQCKEALRAAVASQRMLDGKDIVDILSTYGLNLPLDNQDDS